MSYTVETVNECTKKILFSFENLDLTSQIQTSLKEKQKTSNLKGFRKGKAPLEMIQKMYGPQVENDALLRFIQDEFFKAIREENIQAIGQPSFLNTDYKSGEKVSFDVLVETLPEFDLVDVSGWEFSRDSDKVEDSDVENLTKQYLASKAEMVELKGEDAKVENGHFVSLNFEGEMANGDRPENMKANDYLLEIGSSSFIPGFEEGLVGTKKGEKKSIELTFPAEYHQEDLKNAKVVFHTEILEIKEKKLPELTDELAKELGSESVEDFNEKNRKTLEFEKVKAADKKLNEEILNKLVEEHKFEVPKALVDDQQKHLEKDMMMNLQQQGLNEQQAREYFDKWDSDMVQKAEHQVRSGLILEKISKKYDVEAKEEDFQAKIDEMISMTKMSKEDLEGFYNGNKEAKRNILYAIREEKTFDKLKSEMKIK
jgi:trigger factor